jgi:fructose-1,6-bisphosphatase I
MSTPHENTLALPVGTTLDRFIMRKQEDFPYATGELSQLLRDIALAAKIVNREVNRAGLTSIIGTMGQENVQGEQEDDIIHTGNCQGRYVVAIDPLDGSSNIDVNVSIGTIFSIYRRVTPAGLEATREDFLQGGRAQVAAGYILYGSSTMMVYTTGAGVVGFTYENSLGEFFLSHPSISIPRAGQVFSCNEGYWFDYPEYVREYLTQCKRDQLSGRYVGSLVADYHRNLLKGGIYLYPPTSKTPDGKLRLLYENFPLAFLIEQAGGLAYAGTTPVLDIVPTDFHQRSPLFVGSADQVESLLSFAAETASA